MFRELLPYLIRHQLKELELETLRVDGMWCISPTPKGGMPNVEELVILGFAIQPVYYPERKVRLKDFSEHSDCSDIMTRNFWHEFMLTSL